MTRTGAALLVICGASAMSFIGLLVRLIEDADGFQILFYRSYALAIAVAVIACMRRRVGLIKFLNSIEWPDYIIGVFLAVAFTFYILAMLNTSIASALFILASAPFFSAVIGWLWIGERPTVTTWIAMLFAITGVGIMVFDGFSDSRFVGNMYGLISAFCFALMLVTMRWTKRKDSLGGTFIGGLFTILLNGIIAVTYGSGLVISGWDFGISVFMGAFTIGIGIAFITWAAGYLPAAEVSVLVLIESVFGPIWVWLILGEETTVWVITGGFIVLAAVVLQAWGSRQRAPKAQAETVELQQA